MSDEVVEAARRYNDALSVLRDQRNQMLEDQAFSDPSNPQQWDDRVKSARENDPGGSRPCLVFDQLSQYQSNITGQISQAPPSLHTIPVDSRADKRTADQFDGMLRHVEYASRATQHYVRALGNAARVGVGYLVVRPEVVNLALNYQEPRISSVADSLQVVFDPWSTELDGSDATCGYLLTPLSQPEFKRKYPKKELASFGETERSITRDERTSIIVAEEWYVEDQDVAMLMYLGEEGAMATMPASDFVEGLQVTGEFSERRRVVWWRKMSGTEILEQSNVKGKPAPYPADGIGIVPMYGYTGQAGNRLTYCGIPRRGMAAQRSYNYHQSELHVYMAQAPKSPWIASQRAIRGLEKLWDRASVDARAYLPYNDADEMGAIEKPTRMDVSVNLQNHATGAERALHDIQASLGMYQASLGAPSNESSGVAIDARKEQGEAATANFPFNSAASIGQVGRLLVQMLPRLIDTRRTVRMLGIDGKPSAVTVDPEQVDSYAETEGGISLNLNAGAYDVRVVVGASYTTQRSQAQAALSEVMARNPNLTPAIAPLWAAALDVPNADKLAQVLTAVAPPEVKAILSPDNEAPQLGEVTAQLEQTRQALTEAIKLAEEAQRDADETQAKLTEAEGKNEIAAYEAETNRLKVTGANEAQIQAIVSQLINEMLTSPAPLGDEPEPINEPQSLPAGQPEEPMQ